MFGKGGGNNLNKYVNENEQEKTDAYKPRSQENMKEDVSIEQGDRIIEPQKITLQKILTGFKGGSELSDVFKRFTQEKLNSYNFESDGLFKFQKESGELMIEEIKKYYQGRGKELTEDDITEINKKVFDKKDGFVEQLQEALLWKIKINNNLKSEMNSKWGNKSDMRHIMDEFIKNIIPKQQNFYVKKMPRIKNINGKFKERK